MSKPQDKTGAVIDLNWDGAPDLYAVRGHVDEAALRAAWAAYDDAPLRGPFLALRQVWAFFGRTSWHDDGTFLVRKQPGRGRFKVTLLAVDRPARLRQEQQAAEQRRNQDPDACVTFSCNPDDNVEEPLPC